MAELLLNMALVDLGRGGKAPPAANGRLILWRSIWLSFITTVATLLLGFPTAYFIATRPRQTREIWVFLVTIPFWTNLLIRTFAMQQVLRNEGVLNTALRATGMIDQPLQIMHTDWAILFGMVYVYLPLMVLPLYASMEKLDFRLVEAGYDLYAGRLSVLWRIIIPLVKPGIVAGSIHQGLRRVHARRHEGRRNSSFPTSSRMRASSSTPARPRSTTSTRASGPT